MGVARSRHALSGAEGSPPSRVLAADDDERILVLVTAVLEDAGYVVFPARDGNEALEIALKERPDLAVLDVMMPGHDGHELTRLIREDHRTREVPVLLLTALSSGEDVRRGFQAGADDYMRKPFTTEELQARVAALLERRKMIGRLLEEARTDSLTGVLNRRAWNEEVARELVRCTRYGQAVTLALLDVDRFKPFNDVHGHQAGDNMLRMLGRDWLGLVRDVDLLARLGGDEFALLLPNCTAEEAMPVLSRLRAAVPGSETCSCGVAQWGDAEPARLLMARADAALYQAKNKEGNTIVVAPPSNIVAMPGERLTEVA